MQIGESPARLMPGLRWRCLLDVGALPSRHPHWRTARVERERSFKLATREQILGSLDDYVPFRGVGALWHERLPWLGIGTVGISLSLYAG